MCITSISGEKTVVVWLFSSTNLGAAPKPKVHSQAQPKSHALRQSMEPLGRWGAFD